MSYETDVTTEDENVEITKDPEVEGRFKVTKTHSVTRTMVSTTTIDIKVSGGPDGPLPPMPDRKVVFGYNASTGKVAGLTAMIEKYGQPKVCRVFSAPGKGLMAWDAPLLELLDDDCVLVYSFKDWPLAPDVFHNWMSTKPEGRFPKVYWCLDHEPEQGPASGDPTPDAYRQQWAEALSVHNAHPNKAAFYPTPIFTEYYSRKYRTVPNPRTGDNWFNDFGQVLGFYGVEAVGFDVYDNHESSFRTAEERNELPLHYAKMMNLPLLVTEWGIAEKPLEDPDGTLAAQAIKDNVKYLRKQVDQDVPYVMWFNNDEWGVDDRPRSQEAFMQALDDNPS
jgi:hypothetical protein